jgi:hypothetical protein
MTSITEHVCKKNMLYTFRSLHFLRIVSIVATSIKKTKRHMLNVYTRVIINILTCKLYTQLKHNSILRL